MGVTVLGERTGDHTGELHPDLQRKPFRDFTGRKKLCVSLRIPYILACCISSLEVSEQCIE